MSNKELKKEHKALFKQMFKEDTIIWVRMNELEKGELYDYLYNEYFSESLCGVQYRFSIGFLGVMTGINIHINNEVFNIRGFDIFCIKHKIRHRYKKAKRESAREHRKLVREEAKAKEAKLLSGKLESLKLLVDEDNKTTK